MRTSYWVTVTAEDAPSDYEADADAMVETLRGVFSDPVSVHTITKHAPLQRCVTEVEVSLESDRIVARALFEVDSDQRVTLDKAKIALLLRDAMPFPVKVQKRALPHEAVLA